MKPYRLLICGTNYGRTYLEAAGLLSETFSARGILARGSTRSRVVSERYKLPLYQNLAAVPDEFDIACVVVGSHAPEVILDLLDRGIHILAEHPQPIEQVRQALEKAGETGLVFHINPHFSDLTGPASFIKSCHKIPEGPIPAYIRVIAADRTLWGVLDLLHQAFGSLKFRELNRGLDNGTIVVLNGVLESAGIELCLQKSTMRGRRIPDGSPQYLTDVRITAIYPIGILSLLSIAGPLVWNSNLNRMRSGEQRLYSVLDEKTRTAADFRNQRIRANLSALCRLTDEIESQRKSKRQAPETLIDLARTWEEIRDLIKTND